ncbi:hypothetical protein TRIATDRAFT_279898 [Trichoderma atroviride IMI 206040]|uniref:Major facilitator superfamily (MFS) profile domain-containing protein n=1 Tax=Hypocrea atroviridis (strain ATCC 20476 / IMI 206040) TaxID=452589 RepID=G9NF70_HYPAI|nr:uncharacterized protein TRIATDRAFT_279898 [Trichoderma atroviride IMI 206040]EHK50585.1 hypothetical protein TRIATDRAFT_279898 [Trichoderma atroviride IMI 206040]
MDVDERSRLLPDQPDQGPENVPATTSRSETSTAFPRRHLVYCILISIISFLVVSSSFLQVIPLFDLLMRNVCHRLHPEYEPGSPECFLDTEVGAELMLVTRLSYVLTILPGILTAVPYGFLTDHYGRKFGLFLSIVGLVLAQAFNIIVCLWPNVFHYRLALISPLFLFIGGGSVVLSSILFSMLSDIAPSAHRTTTFFGIGVSWLAAELFIFPLATKLMHTSIWIPVFVGISLYIPTIAIALFLPETLHMKALLDDVAPDLAEAALANQEERDENDNRPWWTRWRRSFTEGLPRFREATVSVFWGNQQVTLLLLTLLITSVGKGAEIMLLQFVNWRFGWDWLKTANLVTVKAAISVALLLLLLPAANYFLTIKREILPKKRDLLFARISCILLAVGSLVVGLAPTSSLMLVGLIFLCFGFPFGLILRGLLSELVDGQHYGLLFGSVALMENLGGALGRPLMELCFKRGANFGGVWTGLPFLVATLFFVLAAILLRYVRVM